MHFSMRIISICEALCFTNEDGGRPGVEAEFRKPIGLAWLEDGQEIQITMRRRVVARLVPDRPKSAAKVKMPGRLEKIHGEKVIGAEEAQAILDEDKGRF